MVCARVDASGSTQKPDSQSAPTSRIAAALTGWFRDEARDLPWRGGPPSVTPWAVLVSEFMLQQTQVERVIPRFLEWITRWPTPAVLAAAEPGEAVRAWDRLGYPRRALWLHRAAQQITTQHDGEVPRNIDDLLALPGVGPYTARAVAVFAFGEHHPVVDTNTRRVLARFRHGLAAAGMPKPEDLDDMAALLPESDTDAQTFNAAMMELGATVCTARAPQCEACPIARWCEWRGASYPDNAPAKRPRQAAFAGSDRQIRGRIMAALRDAAGGVPITELLAAAANGGVRDAEQPRRAYESLRADGLLVERDDIATLP